jgi:hypothetical protein
MVEIRAGSFAEIWRNAQQSRSRCLQSWLTQQAAAGHRVMQCRLRARLAAVILARDEKGVSPFPTSTNGAQNT